MSIEESLQKLNADYTQLCAELGNKIFVDHENEKIRMQNEKEKTDLISRIESIQALAKSLKANEPKKEEVKAEETSGS